MLDQPSAPAVGRPSDAAFVVLACLLDLTHTGPWSLGELSRQVGCELAAGGAVASLRAAGLAHRGGEFVWASVAASRFSELLRE
ncbi:MAG TPA: hypothetical protein VGY13_06870 [Solirubrobacteraceae bacterium]|jgi:hypothetical protein|nr:hypothetical protein [Solirubrobacteraceae bacterium]